MQLREINFPGQVPIDGYGPGFFRIQETIIHGPILISANGFRTWAGKDGADALLALEGVVDLVLLGSGSAFRQFPPAFHARLQCCATGLAVETMATPPACRTYNILLSEGRRIAAALLPP